MPDKNFTASLQKNFLQSWRPYCWMALIGFLLYGKTIRYEFTYLDDEILLQENFYFLKNISNLPEIFKRDIFLSLSHETANYYRPMLNLSFMLETQFLENSSAGLFRFINIVYHLIAVMLLYFFLLKMEFKKELSFMLCIIFSVHPVLTQAVAWIPGRNDSLLAIFLLASFIHLVNYVHTFSKKYFLLHILFFVLGIFTKETAVAIIPVFVFCLFFASQFSSFSKQEKIFPVTILTIGWFLVLLFWWAMRSRTLTNAYEGYFQNIFSNILYNFPGVWQYIGKIFFPFHLSVTPIISDTGNVYGFTAMLLLTIIFIFLKKNIQHPEKIWMGTIWFFLFVIPPLIIRNPSLSHDLHLEHRLYVPMIGMFVIFAELFSSSGHLRNFFSIGISVSVLFFVLTFFHSRNFKDRFVFWENAVKTSPSSSLGHLNAGANFAFLKNYDLALPELKKAMDINPKELGAHNEIGAIYLNENKLDEAEKEFLSELQINPNAYKALSNLGVVYLNRQQYDAALNYLQKTIELNPRHTNTYSNLGYCYMKMNLPEAAEKVWKKTIDIEPAHLNAHYNLVIYYRDRKLYREARQYANAYIRLGGRMDEKLLNEIRANNN